MSDETSTQARLPNACLSNDELAAFAEGQTSANVESHIDSCFECRRLVSAMAETARPLGAKDAPDEVSKAQFGRFTLNRLLGQGGMGQVWAAKDPQLNREVAIKVMAYSLRQLGAEGNERMRREAQAMARLNHPNVVAIYEFGVVDDQVFCAMEIVEGTSWRTWLESPRTWQEILATGSLAARGLHATHLAGLLHRDIKPDNILIADDGRVLLTDFGLAKLIATSTRPTSESAHASSRALALNEDLETLTCTGELLGTPAYMSPESVVADVVDERSDQYSFCVALFEALTGARPFQGQSLRALLIAMNKGPVWPREAKQVPPNLRRVILRGLSFKAEERFNSMSDLIDALERAGGSKRRRQRLTAILVAAAIAVGAAAIVVRTGTSATSLASVTSTARTQINSAWNDSRRAAVRKAIVALETEDAETQFSSVEEVIDEYSLTWLHARIDAWKATHVRNEQSAELLERRLACYDRLAIGLGALVRMFEQLESQRELDQAMAASLNLRPIANCSDPLKVGFPDAAKDDPRVLDLERRLAEVALFAGSRGSDEARLAAAQLVADTEALDVPALRARALFELARFQSEGSEPEAAIDTYWQTIHNAANAQDHALVAQSYFHLIRLLGLTLSRTAEALALEPVARAAIAQSGDDPGYRGMLDSILGDISLGTNALDDAEKHIRSALEAYSLAKGTQNARQMSLLNDLASILSMKGQVAEAAKLLDKALELSRQVKGGIPLNEAVLLQKLSIFKRLQGDFLSAERDISEAIEIFTEQLGPDHVRTWQARSLRAICLAGSGDAQAAEVELRAVSKALSRILPKDDRQRITTAILHAELLEQLGKFDEAKKLAKKATTELASLDVEASVDRAESLRVLAKITAHASPKKALSLYGEALQLRLALPDHSPTDTYEILDAMSHLALRVGKPLLALPWFETFPDAKTELAPVHTELELADKMRR